MGHVDVFEAFRKAANFRKTLHLPTVQILKKQVRGGLGRRSDRGFDIKGLIGLTLKSPDEFAEFQTDQVVYHDDVGDYSTNEPTMDGTADAILMMAMLSRDAVPERS